jgi:Predicted transcriptional regulators
MDTKRMARVFKALSHPHRLELYLKIVAANEASFKADCECFVTDIIASLPIGAPTISHHIKELADAGLISTEKKGKFLVCKVDADLADQVGQMLAEAHR